MAPGNIPLLTPHPKQENTIDSQISPAYGDLIESFKLQVVNVEKPISKAVVTFNRINIEIKV